MAQQVLRATKFDENETEKLKNIKAKKVNTQKVEVKRAALGELGNRALPRNADANVEGAKLALKTKNTKARVDTHWQKGTLLTRKASLRSDATTKTTAGTNGNIAASITTKETNINVKLVNNEKSHNIKVKPKPQEKPNVPVRREESQISRRSLSKLRAALTKDKTSKPLANIDLKRSQEEIVVESHSSKLLSSVENIDSDDGINPVLVSEYVNDIYSYLYDLENLTPIEEDHLKNQAEVTPKMRAVLIDWLNEVHFQFQLVPETFHMTVGIIDRYLQKTTTTSRQYLQLVGATALFIAAKYEELYPPEIGDFVYITDNTYTKTQILDMERKIMKSLNFELGRPLCIHFLRRFSKAAKASDCHHLVAKYILELCTVEYSLCHYRPSEIAAAALLLSMYLINKKNETFEVLWTSTLKHYSGYTVKQLSTLIKKIAVVVKSASTTKLKAVYNKYQSSKHEKISLKPYLNGDKINKICSE